MIQETTGTVNILLVDDQPLGLIALEAILEAPGRNLVTARSGREALLRLLDADFAVILLDVQMPTMDGYQTAEIIRQRERSRSTPIIFLTATSRAETQVFRGYAVGAADYVFKPIAPEILKSKVAIFVDLYSKTELIRRQAGELRRSEQIARDLADARAGLLVSLGERNRELELARARAEEESQFKSRFLAGMSHELRTPLNAIIGFSEILEQQLAGPLVPRQMEFVQDVLHAGRHLLNLINDVLDLSKIQAGKMEVRREWVRLAAIVDATMAVCSPLAQKREIHLEVSVSRDLPDLYADPVRLRQMLYNLVSNGIKFTPRGGRVKLMVSAEAEHARLCVSDTGIGIRAEDMSQLFQEFQQLPPRSGERPEGTGLGLALTKKLVELHGGSISVRSEVNHGSEFSVLLPLLGRTEADVPAAQQSPPSSE